MLHHKSTIKQTILEVLRQGGEPLTSGLVTDLLGKRGHAVSERTVRLYLLELDREGLTDNLDKRGRRITEKGIDELAGAQALRRVGFLSARIDQMTYRMGFDLALRTGTVVVNTTLVSPEALVRCAPTMCKVFEKGYAMGNLMALLEPGERIGDLIVPEGMLGYCSVCSITLNGVLLKHGVPTHSRFGGLMQLKEGRPTRFAEMIMYDGTSIDPLEIFIRSAMTDYLGAVATGNGMVGASFREIPDDSRDLVVELAAKLRAVGLGGFWSIGQPGEPLFDIPVSTGRVGAVVIGGLNPVAVLEESGIRVQSRALAGLLEFNRLFHYEDFVARLSKITGSH